MRVDKETFARLLREHEARVYWQSGKDAPEGTVVHEWRLASSGELTLRETATAEGSEYWADPRVLGL